MQKAMSSYSLQELESVLTLKVEILDIRRGEMGWEGTDFMDVSEAVVRRDGEKVECTVEERGGLGEEESVVGQ